MAAGASAVATGLRAIQHLSTEVVASNGSRRDSYGNRLSVANTPSPVISSLSFVAGGMHTIAAVERFRQDRTLAGIFHVTAAAGHATFAVAALRGNIAGTTVAAGRVGLTLAIAGSVAGLIATKNDL